MLLGAKRLEKHDTGALAFHTMRSGRTISRTPKKQHLREVEHEGVHERLSGFHGMDLRTSFQNNTQVLNYIKTRRIDIPLYTQKRQDRKLGECTKLRGRVDAVTGPVTTKHSENACVCHSATVHAITGAMKVTSAQERGNTNRDHQEPSAELEVALGSCD